MQKIGIHFIFGVMALIAACLPMAAYGGSAHAAVPSAASLSVAVSPNPAVVTTLGPAYATTTIRALPTGGVAPYTYHWVSVGSARSIISSVASVAPILSATLNWGDSFTDHWQVTITDTANHTVSASVDVAFMAPVASGMQAGASAVPIRGSLVKDGVATIAVPSAGFYPLNIYLPADYASTTDRIPVIYATDGMEDQNDPTQYNGWQFPDMARIIESKGIRAIIVGIGGYERRATDYLMPGATNCYAFVTTELIPYIEAKYRVNPSNRTLSGHSYGGLFVGLAFLMDRPANRYFTNFLSLDGSYFNQPNITTALLQTKIANSGGSLSGTTFVLSSTTGGNAVATGAFCQQLLALNIQGWQRTCLPAYDVAHLQMGDEGFSASIGIAYQFAPDKIYRVTSEEN
jgi:hypothetical protein